MSKKAGFLIMAGGTGGHIFPALAVALELQKMGHQVAWLGTRNGLEVQILSKTDIPLYYISIAGIRGKKLFAFLSFPFRVLIAFFQAIRILRKIKPQVVLGMGVIRGISSLS